MGKLRFEPKVKPLVDGEEYKYYKDVLLKAQSGSADHFVFWDLEPKEKPIKTRKIFLFVAEKEGINLRIRADRKKNCLVMSFDQPGKASTSTQRISAEECKERILGALKSARHPLKKSEIVKKAAISTSTWNLRIKELLAANKVKKQGAGRDTRYLTA